MRSVQDVAIRGEALPPLYTKTFHALLGLSEPARGIGINFVLTTRDILRLGVIAHRPTIG